MGKKNRSNWLAQVLQRLPQSWVGALDAWSYRIAMKQRERRRKATQRARAAAPLVYKLKTGQD